MTSYGFVGSVGGVAFEAIAKPDILLRNEIIELSYNRLKPDGYRLSISFDDKTYNPFFPDWKLVPIAKYADSEYNACISLFGPNSTEEFYDIVYHEAFEDTLLGLRLLQADIVLMDMSEFWQLPKLNGELILGLGEKEPDRDQGRNAAQIINNVMQEDPFQSWVLTDLGINVTFYTENGKFLITGFPYYYFWEADNDNYKRLWNEYEKMANEYREKGLIKEHNETVRKANELEPEVYEIEGLTERLKTKFSVLEKINPPVYNAAYQTVRFAALFRSVKKNNINNWTAFMNNIKEIKIKPSIKTPTRWSKLH